MLLYNHEPSYPKGLQSCHGIKEQFRRSHKTPMRKQLGKVPNMILSRVSQPYETSIEHGNLRIRWRIQSYNNYWQLVVFQRISERKGDKEISRVLCENP